MSKKKKQNRMWICMKSTESVHRIHTFKRRVAGDRLSLRKYDPRLRRHTLFTETK